MPNNKKKLELNICLAWRFLISRWTCSSIKSMALQIWLIYDSPPLPSPPLFSLSLMFFSLFVFFCFLCFFTISINKDWDYKRCILPSDHKLMTIETLQVDIIKPCSSSSLALNLSVEKIFFCTFMKQSLLPGKLIHERTSCTSSRWTVFSWVLKVMTYSNSFIISSLRSW